MMQSNITLHQWADQGFRALVFACFFGSIPAQGSELSAQAEQIANLRAEVASLTEEVSTREEAHRMRLRSLETQRADLELQIRRADAQRDALAEALTELEAETEAPVDDEALRNSLVSLAPTLRATIEKGLPFRAAERLADFDALIAKINKSEVDAGQGAARLWAWVEDERRLSRENGIDRQVIELDGREVMVDVARLGMVALFYRTPTGEIGWAQAENTGWGWTKITDRKTRTQVDEVFSALTRGVRTGWFELPADWMEPS